LALGPPPPRYVPHMRRLVPVLGSVAGVALATGFVYALRPIAPTLSLGVVYIPAVLAVSVFWGLGLAIATAVASMVAFNFLFLPPVHTLTLADGRNWTALAVYVVTAVVASDLAARARRRAAEAEQREREAALLSDAAAAMLQSAPLAEIRDRADQLLARSNPIARRRLEAALDSLFAVSADRERLEAEARDAEALRRSDAIKTAVLQTVSHDFRTPLATMEAAIGGLQSTALDLSTGDRAELLDTIGLEVSRLRRLVENLLDLSRLQAGAAVTHAELWPVEELLARAVADAAPAGRVHIDVSDGLPAAKVDAVQVQRALANLIENALKFSDVDGPVELTAVAQGGRLVLEVLDRGRGIDAAEAAALLEPFVRGGAGGLTGGSGLGLAIANGFVGVNGGTLSLEARPGGGTCARVTLPAERVPETVSR
jgi:two-component system, OmpR family, sensor histidine kinase KdpD